MFMIASGRTGFASRPWCGIALVPQPETNTERHHGCDSGRDSGCDSGRDSGLAASTGVMPLEYAKSTHRPPWSMNSYPEKVCKIATMQRRG